MSEFKRVFRYPNEWNTVELGRLCDRVTDRNLAQSDNVLTMSAQHGLVVQETYFNRRVASKDISNYYLLRPGDFGYNKSFSKGFPFGAISRLEGDLNGVVSPLYICFRAIPLTCNAEYLKHLLIAGALDEGLSLIAKEGVRAHGLINVGVKDFFRLTVSLPSPQEQAKITEILSTVDCAIEWMEALIAKQERIKTGLLQDLLTRGIDEHGNLRSESNHQFKDSSLGRIPEVWTISNLGRLATFRSGYAFKNLELSEYGWRVVRISNLHKPEFPYWHYDGKIRESWIVRAGDVLFSWAGVAASIDCILYEGPDALMNQHIYNFAFTSDALKKYVYHFLQHYLPTLRTEIEGGAGQLHLTKAKIQGIPIPLPPADEIRRIADMISRTDEALAVARQGLSKTRSLKAALMQDLLTGRKRVTDLFKVELSQ